MCNPVEKKTVSVRWQPEENKRTRPKPTLENDEVFKGTHAVQE